MAPNNVAPRPSGGAKKLGRFLEVNKLTRLAAGNALGVSDPTVCDWISGKKRPNEKKRRDIDTWTSGKVPAESWEFAAERKAPPVMPFAADDADVPPAGDLPARTA